MGKLSRVPMFVLMSRALEGSVCVGALVLVVVVVVMGIDRETTPDSTMVGPRVPFCSVPSCIAVLSY